MKKIAILLTAMLITASLTACNQQSEDTPSSVPESSIQTSGESKEETEQSNEPITVSDVSSHPGSPRDLASAKPLVIPDKLSHGFPWDGVFPGFSLFRSSGTTPLSWRSFRLVPQICPRAGRHCSRIVSMNSFLNL